MKLDMGSKNTFLHSILILSIGALKTFGSNSIQFGNMESFVKTEGFVFHMEADLYRPGNILFIDKDSLKTVGNIGITTTIVGTAKSYGYVEGTGSTARFHYMRDFVQINNTCVIVSDDNNHCLRQVDRDRSSTAQFAGQCTHSGYHDGLKAKFSSPRGIIRDKRESTTLLVADFGNKVIRSVDVITRIVSTLPGSNVQSSINCMVMSHDKQTLYMTFYNGLAAYSFTSQTITYLTGNTSSSGLGNVSSSQATFHTPEGLTTITSSILAVAEYASNRVRIINLTNEAASSICTGKREHKVGEIDECALYAPLSLLLHSNGFLYIGESGYISRIRVTLPTTEICPKDKKITTDTSGYGVYTYPAVDDYEIKVAFQVGRHYLWVKNRGQACNTTVEVVGNYSATSQCPQIVLTADSNGYGRLKQKSISGGGHTEINLPVGKYDRWITYNQITCNTSVIVVDGNLMSKLDIVVEYGVECDLLKNIAALGLLQTVLEQRSATIKEICSADCQVAQDKNPDMKCTNDTIVVTWSIQTLFPGFYVYSQEKVIEKFMSNLRKLRSSDFQIVISNRIPALVEPKHHGIAKDMVRFVFSPTCANGMKYDADKNICI